MKLDYDCVRDLLLTLEEELEGITVDDDVFGEYIAYPSVLLSAICQNEHLKKWDKKDIIYCTIKIKEAGFIDIDEMKNTYSIADIEYFSITYQGHQYLDNVRDITVWEKIKNMLCSKGALMTIDNIMQVASQLAINLSLHS